LLLSLSLMPAFAEVASVLAAQTERAALALWERYESSALTRDEFVEAIALLVEATRDRVGTLAAAALAARLSELSGERVFPVAVSVSHAGVTAGVVAALAAPVVVDALGVMARDQTFSAGREAFADGLEAHDVPAWRRATNPGACKVCRDLSVADWIPQSVPMWHHTGCGCHQDPVVEVS